MPERAFIFGSFAVLRFQGNVPVKLFQTRDQLSSNFSHFRTGNSHLSKKRNQVYLVRSAISRIKSPISKGECQTSERPTEIMKWERFVENAKLANETKERRVQALQNA